MASPNIKTGGKAAGKHAGGNKPLTSHPLFPAIVALWFGALFGLGSLAIRPTLIESLVLRSHLDLVLPAAAPPLGITARLLLSLGLALLGGVIGALIARRMTRPKVEHRDRSRNGSFGFGRAAPKAAERGNYPGGLRRPLAIEQDNDPSYHLEFAPLPGGDAPQILDVTNFDFGTETRPEAAQDMEPVGNHTPDHEAPAAIEAPVELDLAGFLASDEPFDTHTVQEEIPAMPESHDPQEVRNPFAAPAFSAPDMGHPMPAQPEPWAPAAAPFAAAPTFQPLESLTSEPVMAAAPFAAPAEALAPAPFAAPFAASPAPVFAETAPAFQAAPTFAPAPAFEAAPVPVQAVAPEPAPEPAQEATMLGELSHSDLIARLTQSLKQRREAAAAAQAAPVAPPLFADRMAMPAPLEPLEMPMPATAEPSFGAAFAAPSAQENPFAPFQMPLAQSAPEPVTAAELAPVPAPFVAPSEAAALPSFAAPAFAAPAPPPVAEAAPELMQLPAALRPLNFDEPDHDDDFAEFLPPRHIAMPSIAEPAAAAVQSFQAVSPAMPEQPAAPAFAQPALAAPTFAPPAESPLPEPMPEPVAEAEDDAMADGYSSLLGLSRPSQPRTGFVRIEDEDAAPYADAPEPVVIFPGQALQAPAPFAAPLAFEAPQAAAPLVQEPTTLRRFDAPASGAVAAAPASTAPLPQQDREETERALRSALSSLQRMSATG